MQSRAFARWEQEVDRRSQRSFTGEALGRPWVSFARAIGFRVEPAFGVGQQAEPLLPIVDGLRRSVVRRAHGSVYTRRRPPRAREPLADWIFTLDHSQNSLKIGRIGR